MSRLTHHPETTRIFWAQKNVGSHGTVRTQLLRYKCARCNVLTDDDCGLGLELDEVSFPNWCDALHIGLKKSVCLVVHSNVCAKDGRELSGNIEAVAMNLMSVQEIEQNVLDVPDFIEDHNGIQILLWLSEVVYHS